MPDPCRDGARRLDASSGAGSGRGLRRLSLASRHVRGRDYQARFDLSYPDAMVVASVTEDLGRDRDLAAFVCRDKALTDSGVRAELEALGCTVLTTFRRAAEFMGADRPATEPA